MIPQNERGPGVLAPKPRSELGPQASFARIIHHLAQKASQCPKLDPRRVDRAVGLVLHPDVHERCWVWSKADPVTLNIRGSKGHWYQVNGSCECMDYQRHGPGWWCKHRIARALIIKAEEFMEEVAS